MLGAGFILCLGIVFWFLKMSWRARIRLLSHSLAVDIAVFVFLTVLHWGTYSGLMAAAVGALMVSVLLSLGAKTFGTFKGKDYKPGILNIGHLL